MDWWRKSFEGEHSRRPEPIKFVLDAAWQHLEAANSDSVEPQPVPTLPSASGPSATSDAIRSWADVDGKPDVRRPAAECVHASVSRRAALAHCLRAGSMPNDWRLAKRIDADPLQPLDGGLALAGGFEDHGGHMGAGRGLVA